MSRYPDHRSPYGFVVLMGVVVLYTYLAAAMIWSSPVEPHWYLVSGGSPTRVYHADRYWVDQKGLVLRTDQGRWVRLTGPVRVVVLSGVAQTGASEVEYGRGR